MSAKRSIRKSILLLLLGGILGLNLLVGASLHASEGGAEQEKTVYDHMALFARVLQQVQMQYVDEEKTGYKDLIYAALDGMLQSLDPHSQFMDPDRYSDMREDTSGKFGGLGVVISLRDGLLTIVSPMEDTPGYNAGLLSGDRIIEIEGESTKGVSIQEAVKLLRGEPGTAVTIKILRTDPQEIKEVTITRDIIKVTTVKDTEILDDGIGYVRVTQFNETTPKHLRDALDTLLEEDARALVLDLRNNPGGLFTAATGVAEMFLPRRELIVYTEGRDPADRKELKSGGRFRILDLPMAILVNEGSASASEIVAGALKDHKRAILVGEKTFGKGSVQSVIGNEDGSALRLTTAKYYTPNDRVIHERGIEPDIAVPMTAEDWQKVLDLRRERLEDNGSPTEGIERALTPPGDGEPDFEDPQLQRALDVLRGIMLFEVRKRTDHAVAGT